MTVSELFGLNKQEPKKEEVKKIKDPFKLIYGLEGYLVDDLKGIVTNPKGQSLDDTFVVFDLETTGLCTTPVAGEMDGIIEIGAYKVIDGEIREKFSTFVNPERAVPLEDRIVELTGITQEMVNSAPSYKDVLPDFVKFADGSVLVGHNAAGFDIKFIDFYCRELGYDVSSRVIDTLFLSQKLLRLSNNKLNTVAEHFGVTFNHHRAEDDALATAKIFIELIKLKKSFPDY